MIDRKKAIPVMIVMVFLMAVLSVPIQFWIGKLTDNVFIEILFYLIWLGVPLTMPISHMLSSKRAKIWLHLLAESYFSFAMYGWISAFFAWVLYLIFRGKLPGAEILFGSLFWIAFALFMIGGYINAVLTKTKRITYEMGLKRPVKIALFSDLHLGFFSTKGMLKRINNIVNREQVDAVLIAGDLFDMDFESLRAKSKCQNLLSKMHSTYGTFACLGNHDFYLTDQKKDDFIKQSGICVLSDETVELSELLLVGRRDVRDADRKKWGEISPNQEKKVLILDHNPSGYMEYVEHILCNPSEAFGESKKDARYLLLCGHTHGGQTFPGNIIQRLAMKYPIYGKKDFGSLKMYVTSGAGFWGPPIRVGVNNEVVILNIK